MSETRFLIEIQSWDWPLHVGVTPGAAVTDPNLDGDLVCVQNIEIQGRVLAPEEHLFKLIELRVYAFPRDIIFGDREERNVGSLYMQAPAREDLSFSANLFLPTDMLQSAIFCLGSIWQRVHLWVGDGVERSAVRDFGITANAQPKPGLRTHKA
jgi:hypothetical protein